MGVVIGILIFCGVVFAIVKIQQGMTTGASKVLFSGTNKRGKEQAQRTTHLISAIPPSEVISRFVSSVQAETWMGFPAPRPKVNAVEPNQVHVSLRGFTFGLVADTTDNGTDVEATVLRWKTVNGVIQAGKDMDRMHELATRAATSADDGPAQREGQRQR